MPTLAQHVHIMIYKAAAEAGMRSEIEGDFREIAAVTSDAADAPSRQEEILALAMANAAR